MSTNITSKNKLIKNEYNKVEHIKLIADIIKRMANNHMRWLFTLFSIIAFSMTINKFFLDINDKKIKIVALSISAIITLILEIIAIKVSWNFFDLENTYRKKQQEVIDDKWNIFDMKPVLIGGQVKKMNPSWIMKAGILIILFTAIFAIALIVITIL